MRVGHYATYGITGNLPRGWRSIANRSRRRGANGWNGACISGFIVDSATMSCVVGNDTLSVEFQQLFRHKFCLCDAFDQFEVAYKPAFSIARWKRLSQALARSS
jgi:hypothetical protein